MNSKRYFSGLISTTAGSVAIVWCCYSFVNDIEKFIETISGFKMSHEKPAFFGAQPDERPAVQGHLTMKTVPYDPRFQNTNQNR